MITFEVRGDGEELDVHLDEEGLRLLRRVLDALDARGGHEHLMTPRWGGSELGEEPQGNDTKLLDKVTLHYWPTRSQTSNFARAKNP